MSENKPQHNEPETPLSEDSLDEVAGGIISRAGSLLGGTTSTSTSTSTTTTTTTSPTTKTTDGSWTRYP